ncbi:MAG: ParB/RepB/Spo0J family partition protein [Pseudomonadota bacterium]
MTKKLNALGAALSSLDLASDEEDPKVKRPHQITQSGPVLQKRENLAGQLSEGKVRTTSQRYVEPDKCRMWRRHNRLYHLLSPDNCQDLINDIRAKRSQHTPAIARPLKDDPDGYEYEVIAGARRHFAVNYLREEEGMKDLLYLIEVRRVDDEDAFLLSDAENRGREDISDYERALDYASALREFYNGNQKRMAEKIGVPRSSLRHYLNLASLPDEIVKAFAVPTEIALRGATKLAPLLNDDIKKPIIFERANEIRKQQERAAELGQVVPYDAPSVIKELVAAASQPRTGIRKAPKIVQTATGATLFEIEKGKKYYTVRIPISQSGHATEIAKELKKEIAKAR